MNMIQMKYFITAAKCLNFTKAADKLFITQPALSRQIASMEAELNMQLFIRNNRSVRLTPCLLYTSMRKNTHPLFVPFIRRTAAMVPD